MAHHHFTFYWKNTTFTDSKRYEGLLDAWESGDQFAGCKISKEDYVYSVTILKGDLFLLIARP